MPTLDQIDRITSIISHFAIFFTMIALILQIRQNRLTNKIIFKDRFTASTSRYIKIQELLLSKDSLSHLNMAIYKDKLPPISECQAIKRSQELAICAIMFQLMEDVWLMHDLNDETGEQNDLFSGWEALFKDWMSTDEIAENWHILKKHYGNRFIACVEKRYLKQDARKLEVLNGLNQRAASNKSIDFK